MTENGASRRGQTHRIFVLNDHQVFVEVLGQYLAAYDDIEVVGRGLRGAEAYARIAEQQPDAIVVDPGPRLTDIEPTIRQLRQAAPHAGIVALSLNFDEEYPAVALQAGVSIFVEKMSAAEALVEAIRQLPAAGNGAGPALDGAASDGDASM
jgi:DNA-binding NarL/FixJ family response regulator